MFENMNAQYYDHTTVVYWEYTGRNDIETRNGLIETRTS